jgi:hypothetical protein
MKYSKFWYNFVRWALQVDDKEVPYKLKYVVKILKNDPNMSLVKLAGYLDVDALYLAKFLYNSYKEIV